MTGTIDNLVKTMAVMAMALGLALSPASAQGTQLRFEPRAGDDTARLQRALVELSRSGGGTLLFDRGTYRIAQPVSVPANVSLIGSGCGATVLRRDRASRGQMMFRFDASHDVTVRGIRFAYDAAPDFYRAIGFRGAGSNNVVIRDNCFENEGPREGRGDRWAIELSALDTPSRNLTVVGNRVSGNLQLTAGGGRGVIGALIANNHVVDGWANSIALSTLSDQAVFRDIAIRDNLIENSRAIGIFMGPDQPDTTGGIFENITIADNRILRLQNRFAYGVMLRAPKGGFGNITIRDNIIDGAGAEKTTAVRLQDDHGKGTRRFRNVTICGNTARNFSRGLWIQATAGATIFGNAIDTARPYLLDDTGNRSIAAREETGRVGC